MLAGELRATVAAFPQDPMGTKAPVGAPTGKTFANELVVQPVLVPPVRADLLVGCGRGRHSCEGAPLRCPTARRNFNSDSSTLPVSVLRTCLERENFLLSDGMARASYDQAVSNPHAFGEAR